VVTPNVPLALTVSLGFGLGSHTGDALAQVMNQVVFVDFILRFVKLLRYFGFAALFGISPRTVLSFVH
jgi:hypothetical protein